MYPNRSGAVFFVLVTIFLNTLPDPAHAKPLGVKWEEKIKVASGDAYQGFWQMNESVFEYVDDPTVAINEEGFIGIAWVDQSRKDIFFQLYTPEGKEEFEEPIAVSKSPRIFSWLPRVTVTSTDPIQVFILWQEIVFSGGTHGGDILFAHSIDGGKTFSQPLNLSEDLAGSGKGRLTRRHWHNGSLDLALGPEGYLYAVWTEYEGSLWFSRLKITEGGEKGISFSRPLRIAGGDYVSPARGPSLAVDREGVIYLAWTVGEDKAANIHFAKSVDEGQSFIPPQIVFESDGHSDAPKIAIDGKGNIHLVYAESPTGPFERYHIRYSRLMKGENAFEVPKEISSPHTDEIGSVGFPALSLGGENNLYVIWELFPDAGYRSQGLGMTVSRDGGNTFAVSSVIPGTQDPALGFNGSRQGLLMRKLAVNAAGEVALVNSTFKRDVGSHIWFLRGQNIEQKA